MHPLINNIWKLQSLESTETPDKDGSKQIAALRAKIPTQILAHYDRLRARGKKGVAVVRNQVCTACHMNVPRGTIMTLMGGTDIQLCECCGRYLYLPEPATAPSPVDIKHIRKKTLKPKALSPVA